MKNFILFFLVFLLLGCTKKPETKYLEMYEIINEIIRYNYSDVDLVVLKLKSNQKDYTVYNPDSLDIIQTALFDKALYSKNLFDFFINENMIKSADVDFMYNQIDSLETYCLDSTRIEKKSILGTEKKILKENYGVDNIHELLKRMNANSYIELSIPLISKDNTKMFIEIEYFCGSLCGSNNLYLFEKSDNKWRIKYILLKWIS